MSHDPTAFTEVQKRTVRKAEQWCGESFKRNHGSRCHRNKFRLRSWTQGMKIQIVCGKWTGTKKEREQWFQRWCIQNFKAGGGGGDSLQTTLYALQDETCMGQLSLEKRRNHQKFCISAKYKSKLTEICFLVMHLVWPGSNWQSNYNQHKHSHNKATLWLS